VGVLLRDANTNANANTDANTDASAVQCSAAM
jgi:hypothetical protein